ncbi:hypothetical protein AHAS_Ahas15G0221500 [Arachis hypogaea]
MGVPLEQQGVARWYNNPEKRVKAIEDWACHLSNQAWHANAQRTKSKDWAEAWHANYWNQDKIMGVARQPLGVVRWYKFPERMKEANYMGRATWYRRRGTPFTILDLGVPLE